MGEGLQEARLIRHFKQPGDAIARDEPIFEMETDKATMEIEAPVAGTLVEWLVAEDAIVPIGAVVARIESDEKVPTTRTAPDAAVPEHVRAGAEPVGPPAVRPRNAVIPPRTRAYARECGVSEEELQNIVAASGGKVLPADVDAWLASRASGVAPRTTDEYEDLALSPYQRTLVYRLQQRAGEVIPATEEIELDWRPIDEVRRELKATSRDGDSRLVVTPFLLFAWCIARASAKHPVFRSTYIGNGMVRRHKNLHLGIAVTRGEDELVMARVEAADTLSFQEFVRAASAAIKRARAGEDQASALMQLTLSNLAGTGIVRATPVVAAPAVGTIFVGAVREVVELRDGKVASKRVASVSLTFDHRITNGIGAARFLADIAAAVADLRGTVLTA
jgi:pyruvate dehydrogenase E2 component (dihydrolipoamide acetyltransferase)